MKKSILSLITALIGIAFVTSCAQKKETAAISSTATTTHERVTASTKKKAEGEASPSPSESPYERAGREMSATSEWGTPTPEPTYEGAGRPAYTAPTPPNK